MRDDVVHINAETGEEMTPQQVADWERINTEYGDLSVEFHRHYNRTHKKF